MIVCGAAGTAVPSTSIEVLFFRAADLSGRMHGSTHEDIRMMRRICLHSCRRVLMVGSAMQFAEIRETPMLYWSLMFLLVALVAAVFGFGGIAASAAGIAKILFVVFLVLAVVSAAGHAFRGRGYPG